MDIEKQLKQELKLKAQKHPEQYYPVKALQQNNFKRYKCSKCSTYFWSVNPRNVCGSPKCSNGFTFIGKKTNSLSYIDVWKRFAQIHKKLGYTPIKRLPVVARWNPTTDFTIASIAAFQPYVVSGEVAPPANPLVIPQFCLRFSDLDSVGLSNHFTGFVMLGQHAFVKTQDYKINKYFSDHLTWLKNGMKIKLGNLTIHEDAWSGGGNLGNSVEFFSNGLELSNQVYMQYEIFNNKIKELKIKVLDMGQGQERAAWFTQGSATSYDATFPTVMNYLYKKTNINKNPELLKKFFPYSSYFNIDEFQNLDKSWEFVAKQLGLKSNELKQAILPLSSLYAVAEHSRALLVALSDSAIPSNTGSSYNLRIILRRALSFIDKYNFNLDLFDICKLHANYLKPQYPELSKNLSDIQDILEVEREKYENTKQRTKQIITNLLKEDINEQKLLQLYDSQGIQPEILKEEASKLNKFISIPNDFYVKVSNLHEKQEQKHQTKKQELLNLSNLQATELVFYQDYKKDSTKAKVLKIIDNKVILDKTVAYATSGGQLHDLGIIGNQEFIDVFKQGNIIIHVLKDKPKFKVNDIVEVKINLARRLQLAHHHTSAHILNAAARKILGNHVNQASAYKDIDKARLDITHYKSLTDEELQKIEDEANKIINKKIKIEKSFMPRTEAEKKFGMTIYQGPAVPGKLLRIVNIKGIDVECCSGTHLDNTSEAGKIKILKSSKISDSIVRIEYVAGKRAIEEEQKENYLLKETAQLLDCTINQIPARTQELFELWKDVVKKGKKNQHFELTSIKTSKRNILQETSDILKTQKENIPKTISRFIEDIKKTLSTQ